MSKDFTLQAARLIDYLGNLDDGLSANGDATINAVADRMEVGRDDLIAFRDGNLSTLNRSLVIAWGQMLGSDAQMMLGEPQDPWDFYGQFYREEDARLSRYEQFEIMEETQGVVESALYCWADMACTGSITEENRYSSGFVPRSIRPDEKTQAILEQSSHRLFSSILPPATLQQIVRDMCKYGSRMGQVGIARRNGALEIAAFEPLSVYNMKVLEPATPARYYGWFAQGQREPSETWPAWKVVHFANRRGWGDKYGTSIMQSSIRSWVQVEAMEAGMMIRRLERAAQRYKWTIDTSQCADPTAKWKEVQKYREAYRKQKTIDGSRDFHNQKVTIPPGEDLFIGKSGKESPADVEALEGDAHLGETRDFDHFFNKFLAGLGPPKHHLGYEQDTMRSVGTDLTIVFARKSRRVQMHICRAINHLIWLDLILHGVDPRSLEYLIIPPTLGTRDELIRAQVMLAHAQVCVHLAKCFSTSGKVPSPAWFLRYVMGFDDAAIEQMDLQDVVPGAGKNLGTDDPETSPKEAMAMRNELGKDQELAADLRFTKYVLGERLLAFAKPDKLVEMKILSPADVRPGEFYVDTACQQLRLSPKAING